MAPIGSMRATYFEPPRLSDEPRDVFKMDMDGEHLRLVHKHDPTKILLYAAGVCRKGRGSEGGVRGGCAFVCLPSHQFNAEDNRTCSRAFRLETCGPTGERHPTTNNRAGLRAVLAALDWILTVEHGPARTVVIATDSVDVVEGAAMWLQWWESHGWRQADGQPVHDRDLWEKLVSALLHYWEADKRVQFWRIPRPCNAEASALAAAATAEPPVDDFTRIA